jgi:hypothetical protein
MAKAGIENTKRISFRQLYLRLVQHFGGAEGPALQHARACLLKLPHAYLDGSGALHQNDLSADFVEYADFQPKKSCAILRLIHVQGAKERTIFPYEAYRIEVAVPVTKSPEPKVPHAKAKKKRALIVEEYTRRCDCGEMVHGSDRNTNAQILAKWMAKARPEIKKPYSASSIQKILTKVDRAEK